MYKKSNALQDTDNFDAIVSFETKPKINQK